MKNFYSVILPFLILPGFILAQTGPDFDWVRVNDETVSLNGSISVELALGQTFSLKARVSNVGDDSPAGYNNITYSFPQFTGSSHIANVANGLGTDTDLQYTEYWGSGVGGDGYADYVMVEAVDTDGWDGSDNFFDEENEFEVNIQPLDYGIFDIDRMGSLNLTWDNMDSAIAGLTLLNFEVSFSNNNNVFLTTRDQNKISTYSDETILFADRYKSNFGTMTELNQTTAYLNKITAYAAYDNDLSDNPDWADFSDIIKNLAKSYFSDHYGLSAITMLQAFSSENISSNNSVYYANDGMVPLQSALLLDISNGTPFCTMDISEKISLLNNNIALKKQVLKQRIFSNEDGIIDHLHLLDAPLHRSYWATLQADILSYIEVTGLTMADLEIPETFILKQNYPNPFNPSTQIKFGLPKPGQVSLEIFNAVGQKIMTLINSEKAAGYHTINFDGSRLASGTYYYRLNAENFQQVRKMILVR